METVESNEWELSAEEKERMVMVTQKEHTWYMDGYLKANLDYVSHDVKRRKFDSFILIAGKEGYGKSTLAMQMALYCDKTFNIDRVCFTAEQFLEATRKAEKFQAIVFDETMGYLSARGSMSKFNKTLIKVMSEMRSKRLFVFLCIPNFFIMDWYVANHRSSALVYIPRRGVFYSYDYPTKHKLWMDGKKTQSYNVSPNFFGPFVSYFPLNEEQYEAKKQEAINQWAEEQKDNLTYKRINDRLMKHILHNNLISLPDLVDITGIKADTISKLIKDKEVDY